MAYCALPDVQALNAQRTPYSGTTKPTDTQVGSFINQIAAEIDAVLSAAGVVTPVTTPAGMVARLVNLNALGAAALAEMAKFPEADRGTASSPQGDRYWAMYRDGLAALRDGSAIDADTPRRAAGTVLARSYQTDNPDGLSDTDLAPVFSMRDQF